MILSPRISQFREKYLRKENQIVYTRLIADLDTAVSLLLKLTNAKADSFVLESVTGGEVRGRYSFIGMRPDLIWKCKNKIATINRFPDLNSDQHQESFVDPLASLRMLLSEMTMVMPDGLPSGSAGLFGYLGYDIIRLVENLPSELPDPLNLPDSILMRPSVIVVLDGVKGEVIIISPAWYNEDNSFEASYGISQKLVTETLNLLEAETLTQPRSLLPPEKAPLAISNFTHSEYLSTIRKAKDYIIAGDVFQVVPSQRWEQSFTLPPFSLYRALRRTNPSPFMFYFNMGEFQIVGASPEILVRVVGRKITIRPIAGTRARGKTEEEDLLLEEDLLSDPKELSEHLMLLDLGRNDVGKVSKIGSVRPTEKFIIEKYSHVMHIVSNVTGELKPEEDSLSALLSGLPAGTVSGAPKIRAMEIIDKLEPEKRGVYGGGCGYFSANGDMDMCIALRTGVIKNKKLYIQAGGGVVFDSNPEAEFIETVNKSKALRAAAEQASMFASIYDLS